MNKILKYKTLDLRKPTTLNLDWSRSGDKDATSMHSIASYLAMFAPALPKHFIKQFSKKGDIVMDPFSGRGTTALKAREMGRSFVGSDLNPYALVVSRSKIDQYQPEDLLSRLVILEKEFKRWYKSNQNIYKRKEFKELSIFYGPKVLSELVFLQNKIGKKWRTNNNVDNAILAFSLGLLHGPARKNGDSIYFSLSMSNSISMSPNYVKNYAKKNNLKRPSKSIFKKIENRIEKKYNAIVSGKYNGTIIEKDATKENNSIKNNSINLVVTSPPYLSVVNYTHSNWIKLWLLGYKRQNLKKEIILSDSLKYEEYKKFITKVLNVIHPKLKKEGHVCLIVGDVHGKKLIESVWNEIKESVNYDFVEIYYDYGYSQKKKVLNTMNERKGKATIIEKVLVIRKGKDVK